MKRALLVFSLALLGGCSSDFTAPDRILLRVEPLASAEVSEEATHRFTVLNTGKRNIYLPACNSAVRLGFIMRRDGASEEQISSMCLGIYDMLPVELEPGQSYTGMARVPPLDDVQVQPFLDYAHTRREAPTKRVTAPVL